MDKLRFQSDRWSHWRNRHRSTDRQTKKTDKQTNKRNRDTDRKKDGPKKILLESPTTHSISAGLGLGCIEKTASRVVGSIDVEYPVWLM